MILKNLLQLLYNSQYPILSHVQYKVFCCTAAKYKSHQRKGENRQLVTHEPVEFEKQPVKFKSSRKVKIILKKFIEYTWIQ